MNVMCPITKDFKKAMAVRFYAVFVVEIHGNIIILCSDSEGEMP